MTSTKELFEGYVDEPKCLNVTELTHLKLIAISMSHFFDEKVKKKTSDKVDLN